MRTNIRDRNVQKSDYLHLNIKRMVSTNIFKKNTAWFKTLVNIMNTFKNPAVSEINRRRDTISLIVSRTPFVIFGENHQITGISPTVALVPSAP